TTPVVQRVVESAGRFTQAGIVMPLTNADGASLATVTRAFVPLNDNAFPNTPPTCNAPAIVPLLPLPEKIESAATLPAASLKFSAMTRPFVLPSTRIDAGLENAEVPDALVAVGVADTARTRSKYVVFNATVV